MVNLIRRYVVSGLVVGMFGCSSFDYPDHGKGGLAENYQDISIENYQFSPVMPDEPLGPEHGLRFDWQLTKLHLDALIQEGARWCFPAAVVQALEKQNRIARELEGGLLLDAANDLVIQRRRLNQLEQQLDYVLSQTTCTPPDDIEALRSDLNVVAEIYALLNIDNQFAVDSAEINPKYMGHLAEAAYILRDHPNLTLVVTGHADVTGSPDYNQKLAQARAEQVKRYLTVFGIISERVTTKSVGDSLPLYEGETPAVRLTNRRVSIEVISPNSDSDTSVNRNLSVGGAL
ncbi:OmpA family protein [Vibrio antiquarius]|uniref:OmpA family protein n=1 Tax=Vibrio TaxID=662 RepID=UPI001FABB0C7|nr:MULTISPECIES: OmpA family protein [Vibrio]MCJ0881600.1 OmpA family protein [Vibrio sp. CCB-PB317]MCR9846869.1 OmpA family protein [Vibrio antiquarius]MCR9915378.1 OmpA family protein [Vibrio antiquarius]MCR9935831.1 OmpA family protein [Vibrio antiquarius]MCS0403531.1 OmpA family protein [Vibrio diabolicus]